MFTLLENMLFFAKRTRNSQLEPVQENFGRKPCLTRIFFQKVRYRARYPTGKNITTLRILSSRYK